MQLNPLAGYCVNHCNNNNKTTRKISTANIKNRQNTCKMSRKERWEKSALNLFLLSPQARPYPTQLRHTHTTGILSPGTYRSRRLVSALRLEGIGPVSWLVYRRLSPKPRNNNKKEQQTRNKQKGRSVSILGQPSTMKCPYTYKLVRAESEDRTEGMVPDRLEAYFHLP